MSNENITPSPTNFIFYTARDGTVKIGVIVQGETVQYIVSPILEVEEQSNHNEVGGQCQKHGTLAWHAENIKGGQTYGPAQIGGLDEPCGVAGQVWWPGPERATFYVPAFCVATFEDHYGGSGWYVEPKGFDITDNLSEQADQLLERDGEMITYQVVFTEQSIPILVSIRCKTQINQQPAEPMPTIESASVAGICNFSTAIGPAILEYQDPSKAKATVMKLNEGEKSARYEGGCFPFQSQAELDARWQTHKAEFLAKNANGVAVEK